MVADQLLIGRARFRPSVVKQMQEAAAAIRAKNPPAAPEPRK